MEKIPHVINYVWFGGGKHSKLQKKCMKSWEKFCPDYEIIRWDESNFDVSSAPLYVRQAYEAKKWAFVSDYVRIKVLYENGGLYFDTDTEVLKDISHLVDNNAFLAFESNEMLNTGVVGACKGDTILSEILNEYENISFFDENGNMNTVVTGKYITKVFTNHGLLSNGKEQQVENWKIYPFTYFYPVKVINNNTYYTDDTCIVHWFEGTWFPEEYQKARRHDKNLLIQLFRKSPLAKLYYKNRK